MRGSASLWSLRAASLERARKALLRGEAEGLHELRVALRRLSVTARALGKKRISRKARAMARSLAAPRQLEVDRRLLARLGQLGFLSADAVTAMAARWEKLAARGARRLARAGDGRAVHRLVARAARLAKKSSRGAVRRVGRARRASEGALAGSLEGQDDRALHRLRLAVKKARYLAEDLAALGLTEWTARAERERALQEALGRWNDLRLFRRRVAEARSEAEERGAVTLVAELEHLLTALEPTIASTRRAAVEASRPTARVVSIGRRSA